MRLLVLASIPSPSANSFNIGPLRFTFYGIVIAFGVALAWRLTTRRFEERGGDGELADKLMARVLVFGFLGARVAYVSTHLSRYSDEWWKVIAIWEGGLALFGGLTAGALTVIVLSRRWRIDRWDWLDSVAPAVPLAQALGRWGNYFNQELFGTPSTLPWAVEIAPQHRPAAYANAETFHPTFLYESLWNLALAGTIMWMSRRYPSLKGRLIGVYLVGYGILRFLLELIRTDTTFRLVGLSRNGWVSIGAILIGVAVLTRQQRAKNPSDDELPQEIV